MVSESGKLESTMMHTAHNGLTNCSFVSENTPLFYRFCHHSARKTHCDILCVAVICLASRVHMKSNIILKISLLASDAVIVLLLTARNE